MRGVDVQPQPLRGADVGDLVERVERPVDVVPAVATTAIGAARASRAAAISAMSAAGRMRKRSSVSTAIAPASPKPMIWAARDVE